MGTRGLTGFVVDNHVKAGYQQYDSYPGGVGGTVLRFAQTIAESGNYETIQALVRALRVVSEQDTPTPADLGELATRGITSAEQVSSGADWYAWLRSTQGDPQAILDSGYILDSVAFAEDSLFCEYAYLINLDDRTLEAYIGFQDKYHKAGRFAHAKTRGWKPSYLGERYYYPIALKVSYPLDALPTQEQFEDDMLTDEQRAEIEEERKAIEE